MRDRGDMNIAHKIEERLSKDAFNPLFSCRYLPYILHTAELMVSRADKNI